MWLPNSLVRIAGECGRLLDGSRCRRRGGWRWLWLGLERWDVKAKRDVESLEMGGTVWVGVGTDVEQASPEVEVVVGYGQGNCVLLNSRLTTHLLSSAAARRRQREESAPSKMSLKYSDRVKCGWLKSRTTSQTD